MGEIGHTEKLVWSLILPTSRDVCPVGLSYQLCKRNLVSLGHSVYIVVCVAVFKKVK